MLQAIDHGLMYYPRDEWKSKHGAGRELPGSVSLVIVHHSLEPDPSSSISPLVEAAQMRGMEQYHFDQGWGGISYQWLVFPSGRVYEGRGWNRVGAHTVGQNSKSVGICLVFNGEAHEPTKAMWDGLRLVITSGLAGGHIAPGYEVRGHQDFKNKICPGKFVYRRLGELGGHNSPRPVLRGGSLGEDVSYLQHKLGVGPTGYFGPITLDKVKEFQKAHGLDPDGIVGPRTWAAIG